MTNLPRGSGTSELYKPVSSLGGLHFPLSQMSAFEEDRDDFRVPGAFASKEEFQRVPLSSRGLCA